MKHFILPLFFVLSIFNGEAQDHQILWQANAGGTSHDQAFNLASDTAGNFIMVGYTLSSDIDIIERHSAYYEDYFVTKFDADGNLLWAKTFGGTNQDIARGVVTMADLSIYVLGYSWSPDGEISSPKGVDDFWLIHLDKSGNLISEKSLGGSSNDEAYCIAKVGGTSNLLMGGTTISSDNDVVKNEAGGYYDAWLVKTDTQGEILWSKTFGGSQSEAFKSVVSTNGGGVLAVGTSDTENGNFISGFGSSDFYVVFTDGDGNLQWEKRYGGSNWDEASDAVQISDTSFVVLGNTYSSDNYFPQNKGNYDIGLLAINFEGDTIWSKTYGGSREDKGNRIILTKDNSLLVIGSTVSDDYDVHGHNPGNKDFWILKLTLDGDTVWTKCLGSSVEDAAWGVAEAEENNFVVAGYAQYANNDVSKNYGLSDFWMAKIRQNQQTGINSLSSSEINIFSNPGTNDIYFQTDLIGEYTVELIDLQGKKLLTKNITNSQGRIETNDFASGIYYLHFKQNKNQLTKKVIIRH